MVMVKENTDSLLINRALNTEVDVECTLVYPSLITVDDKFLIAH